MARLTPDHYLHYVRDLFAQEDEALKKIGSCLSDNERKMQVGPEEGKMLHVLLTLLQAKRGVEIGTLHGYSAVWLARALAEDGHLWVVEKDHRRIEPTQQNIAQCQLEDKVTVIHGDATICLSSLETEGPFDFVFIDANKSGYVDYLNWAEDNVRKGGLIIGDNSFLFGHVVENTPPKEYSKRAWEVMREFNQRLADPEKYTSILIPTEQGMTVAIKNF
jgi:predicted O-methyltransferase YrrM